MGAHLLRLRGVGYDFDRAWEKAFARIRWPGATKQRRAWKDAMEETKDAWRAAYERWPQLQEDKALAMIREVA